jgi:hypothetical protein
MNDNKESLLVLNGSLVVAYFVLISCTWDH